MKEHIKDTNKEALILDVAKEVIAERGFSQTRMDDIAQRANIAKGTLYLYFKSKEDLFTKLVESEYDKVLKGLDTIFNKDDDVITKIDAFVEGFLKYMENNRGFFTSIMFEAPSIKKKDIKERVFEKNRLINEKLKDVIRTGIDEGIIRNDIEITVILSAIFGLVSRVVFYAIHFEKEKPLISYKDSILKVIFSGILKEKGGILW